MGHFQQLRFYMRLPYLIELLLNSTMESLTDAIGLRIAHLGLAVSDILNRQIELIFMVLYRAAVFRPPVGEDAQQRNIRLREPGEHAIIKQISCGQGALASYRLTKVTRL